MAWQKMETHPGDGEEVLLIDTLGRQSFGFYEMGNWFVSFDGEKAVVGYGDEFEIITPIAWRPKPSPPDWVKPPT